MTKAEPPCPGTPAQHEKQPIGASIPPELKAALGSFRVQKKQCPTCIYRKDKHFDLEKLESDVRDNHVGFKGFRICHHSATACCRGFWNHHKDEFAAGQIAQRLGLVEYVQDDNWIKKEADHG